MAFAPFDLSGRVALITGGNSGIGLGMARGLAEAGCEVCIWGTNEEKNTRALETLSSIGPRVSALICDVVDETQVNESFARTVELHQRVDGCFFKALTPPLFLPTWLEPKQCQNPVMGEQ